MQTFFIDYEYQKTAAVLDKVRLNKQCLEVVDICRSFGGVGHRNHPITKMWYGYPGALVEYGLVCCHVANKRNINCKWAYSVLNSLAELWRHTNRPPWHNDVRLHDSHKSQLLRKGLYDSVKARLRFPECAGIELSTVPKRDSSHIVLSSISKQLDAFGVPEIPNYYEQFNWNVLSDLEYIWDD